MPKQRAIIWTVILFGISMAMFESAVVIYLRELYYPNGFQFPLVLISNTIGVTELFREFASLVMILTVAYLAGKHFTTRFAWFLIIFAIWDIFYYVFLKLLLGWPESFLTWDILFLLPVNWTGPVITPVLVSVIMIALGWLILYFDNKAATPVRISRLEWYVLIAGAFVVFVSFIWDYSLYLFYHFNDASISSKTFVEKMNYLSTHHIPTTFNWFIFVSGVLVILYTFYLFVKRNSQNRLSSKFE